MPVEIKKMLMNISLKGITFPSACTAYSDSEMISPARNAPRARERPARELIQATERPITTMLSKKSSLLRVFATWYRRKGTT